MNNKHGYLANIEHETLANENFRKVLYTGGHLQLVVMALQPGEDIGLEVHETHDQFIRIEEGKGIAFINGVETPVSDDWAIIIPAGSQHNVTNTGDAVMKLYTVYGPAEHREGIVHPTKADAEAGHEADHFDGVTTE